MGRDCGKNRDSLRGGMVRLLREREVAMSGRAAGLSTEL
jgi:hypothetical protein